MSTTQSTRPPAQTPSYLAPDEVFDAVWESSEVCNGCFARIRQHVTLAPDIGVSKYAPQSYEFRTDAGTVGHHPADLPTSPPHTWCGECGNEHGAADSETLSRREMLQRCPQLADRVEAMGIGIDRDALRHVVRDLKSRPKLEAYDTEIFERGVKVAVRRGRQ